MIALKSRVTSSVVSLLAGFQLISASPLAAQTVTYSTLVGSTAATNDGTGSAAVFTSANLLLFDGAGDLYVRDADRVRRITPSAVVTTTPQGVPGSNFTGFARDSSGNLYLGQRGVGDIIRVELSGVATRFYPAPNSGGAFLPFLSDVTMAGGIVYVADNTGVWKIAPDATATRFAGGGAFDAAVGPVDGPVGVASFDPSSRIVVDASGTVYVATSNHQIRRITPDGATTTIAGAYKVEGSADGAGVNARFSNPTCLAVDAAGNLYICDAGNHTIRRMSPDGTVTTIAGQVGVTGVTQNADGPALSATFAGPFGLAVASSGDLFIGDGPGVRRLTSGSVSTFAGSLALPFGPGPVAVSDMTAPKGVAFGATFVYVTDAGTHTLRAFNRSKTSDAFSVIGGTKNTPGSTDGPAARTGKFGGIQDIGFDGAGAAYVIDTLTIRKVASDVVTTVAGKTEAARSFDGTGVLARFTTPRSLAVEPGGTVYVADGCRIRKMTPAGVVTTLAGGATCGTADGTGSEASFSGAMDLAVDPSGNVYVADTSAVRKVTPAGVVTTLAGLPGASPDTVDGTGPAARFFGAAGIAVAPTGDLYVGDSRTLRRVTTAGVVTTIAGSPAASGSTDGTGSAARFVSLSRIAVSPSGTIYGLDPTGLRAITPGGAVSTVVSFSFGRGIGIDGSGTIYVAAPVGAAGVGPGVLTVATDGTLTIFLRDTGELADGHVAARARFNAPAGLAWAADGSLAIADTGNHTIRVVRNNLVTTLAGSAGSSGNVDATSGAARFSAPQGVAFDSAGNVYVADTGNNAIRKVTPAGVVSTVVPGLTAPKGVAVDASGTLYIADSGSHTIRIYSTGGTLTTLAGLPGSSGSADGTGAAARFSSPAGLALAPDGTIYVTDTGNHTIRAVIGAGAVTTVGGSAGLNGRVDGAGSTARFTGPEAIAVDSGGSLYIADTQNGRLRLGVVGTATAPVITANPLSRSAALHQTVQFTCAATGNPLAAYEWQRSNADSPTFFAALTDSSTYSGVNTPTVTVSDPGTSLNGTSYRCRALNAAGSAVSAAASLTLAVLSLSPSAAAVNVLLDANGSIVRKSPDQAISVIWSGSGAPAWTVTANQSWVQLTNASGAGNGSFAVGLASPGPSATSAATLTVSSPADPELIATMTFFSRKVSGSELPPFGVMDTPANNATGLQGSLAVTGWAVDDIQIDHVEIWRDAVAGETTPVYPGSGPGNGKIFIGYGVFVPGARSDIASLYGPSVPDAYRAGWGYMLLTQGLWNQGNGTFTLYAFAFDAAGTSSAIGTKTITIDNANATKPFGAIDTPGQGGTVSGTIQNFGWGLTPGACSIANPNVQVSIDSGPLVPVVYGDVRSDIAGAFPTYTNAAAAGGHYTLDTTTLNNGQHTIGWFVTDSCGRADGVGSRFFTVANGASMTAPAAATALPEAGLAVNASQGQLALRGSSEGEWGLRRNNAVEAAPGVTDEGTRVVRVEQTERIDVRLPGAVPYASGPLPLGSSLDAATQTFSWQPAAGFLGAYDLAFSAGAHVEKLRVVVGPPIRMTIDTPRAGNVLSASGFTLAGWAVDLASLDGAGIDTLHVWAYPVGGGEPVFVGVAGVGGARPDVAKLYGGPFADAGFTLSGTLAPGTYDLVVFAHSAATNTFAGAAVVRVIVR